MSKLILANRPLALSIAMATLVMAGCSLAPKYEQPVPPIPTTWNTPDGQAGMSASATLHWREFVLDPTLQEIIETALEHNRDLRQAVLNVQAVQAQYRVTRADRAPAIDGSAAQSRERVLADGGPSQVQSHYQVGLGLAAFELDFFGRVRNLSESALREYLATEEGTLTVRISLIAEVIQAYLTREGAQRKLELIRQTLGSRERSLHLISERRKAGTATVLDYQEALGLTEQAKAELERASREFQQAGNALNLLAGMTRVDVQKQLPLTEQHALVQALPAGVPSDLLVMRPDIKASEHRLLARNADIGAARAAFFPRISLTGFWGTSSSELSDLFSGGQHAWNFTPQVSLPIFNAGRNRANLDRAIVRRDAAIAQYEQTIQQAFREVSDALVATTTLRREEAAQRALGASSAKALQIAEARYRAGVDDFLRYLEVQRNDFSIQVELIEVNTQRQIALATLFRALGGGWIHQQSPPSTSVPESLDGANQS